MGWRPQRRRGSPLGTVGVGAGRQGRSPPDSPGIEGETPARTPADGWAGRRCEVCV